MVMDTPNTPKLAAISSGDEYEEDLKEDPEGDLQKDLVIREPDVDHIIEEVVSRDGIDSVTEARRLEMSLTRTMIHLGNIMVILDSDSLVRLLFELLYSAAL